jgi:hypothetical protein
LKGNFLAYIAQAAAFIDDVRRVGKSYNRSTRIRFPSSAQKQQTGNAEFFAQGGAQQLTTEDSLAGFTGCCGLGLFTVHSCPSVGKNHPL